MAVAFLWAAAQSLQKAIEPAEYTQSFMPMKGIRIVYSFSICGFIKSKHYLEGFLVECLSKCIH